MDAIRILLLIGFLGLVALRVAKLFGAEPRKPEHLPDPDDPRWDHNRPKRKKKKKKRADDAAPMASASGEPRPQHYGFAHARLRMLLRTGSAVWPVFRAAKTEAELNMLLALEWDTIDDCGAVCPSKPTGRPIDDGILVHMPEPLAMTEAYSIAVVEHEGVIRYFTLEKSLIDAVLCEWSESSHINNGPCALDDETFLASVRARMLDVHRVTEPGLE